MIPRKCKQCGKEFLAHKAKVAIGRAIYCSKACSYLGCSKYTEEQQKRAVIKRLEKYKTIDLLTGCWLWTQQRCWNGKYGAIKIDKKTTGVHRAAMYAYHNFDLSSNLLVCHHCDTPLCFNPEHLFIGTAEDNINDCISKGRPFGGPIKIQRWQYTKIMTYFFNGETKTAIARHMGVSYKCIHRIIEKELARLNIKGSTSATDSASIGA